MTSKPTCSLVEESRAFQKKVVRSVQYDGADLLVYFQGVEWAYGRVVFRNPIGVRILDESNVLEFWNEYSEPNGWMWEVKSGGWLDLELTRPMFNTMGVALREYFIVDEMCINVLCHAAPEIENLGAPPDA